MTANTTNKNTVRFFDSWGRLWQTCTPNCVGVQNFGPTGYAFEIECAPEIPKEMTQWAFYKLSDRVLRSQDEFGFDLLLGEV